MRPTRCPCCGAPGAPAGGRIGLHGHGLRERSQLGPAAVGESAAQTSLWLRRYACQRCGAVVVSAPRDLLPRLRYRAVAVALALALWAAEGWPGHRVRQQVSPLPSVGNEPMHGWRSLARWARRYRDWWRLLRGGPPDDARAAALDVVRQLAAKAPIATGHLPVDACAGAAIAMPIDPGAVTMLVPPSGSVVM